MTKQRAGFFLAATVLFGVGGIERSNRLQTVVAPAVTGDSAQYYYLAGHLQNEGTFSLDGVQPIWTRLPGWPLVLGLTRPGQTLHGRLPDQDLSPWSARVARLNLAIDLATFVPILLLGLWLGASSWSLLGAGWWAFQPWTSGVAGWPLCDPLATLLTAGSLAALAGAVRDGRPRGFVVAGLVAGMAQLVRPDSLLLMPSILAGAWLSRRGKAGLRVALYASLAWGLALAPWLVRNSLRFGTPHLLAGAAGVDDAGKPFDRAAVRDWLLTWADDEWATTEVGWRIPGRPIYAVPRAAATTREQRNQLERWVHDYNARHFVVDDDLGERMRQMARENLRTHPFKTVLILPARRIARMLLGPRDGCGLGQLFERGRARKNWLVLDRIVTICGLIALLCAVRWAPPTGALLLLFVALRVALIAMLPWVETRYLFEVLPVLFAAASLGAARLSSAVVRAATRRT